MIEPRQGKRPLISVIVPTCDRAETLARCLRQLAPLAQTLEPSAYEVIVTDDGLCLARDRLAMVFPFVQWVKGPRRGPAANRNAGVRAARGEWLAFTDDDCEPQASWLEAFAKAAREPGAVALEGVTSGAEPGSYWEEAPSNLGGGFFWSCNIALSTAVFRALGGFDENYSTPHLEDVDLKCALQALGHEIRFCPQAVVHHPPRVVTWARRVRRSGYFASDVYFGRKWHRRGLLATAGHLLRTITWHWLIVPLRARRPGSLAAIPVYGAAVLAVGANLIPWYRRAVRLTPSADRPPDRGGRAKGADRDVYVEYLEAQYGKTPGWVAEHHEWVKRFGISGRVLDAGSGFGHLATACVESGGRVVGVERNFDLIARAPTLTGFRLSICGDVTSLPLASCAFDWVLSNQVIEHLSDPAAFLRECVRVLRPGGRLFLTTPNRRSHFATRRPTLFWAALRRRAQSDPTHVHEFIPPELVGLVERSGLTIIHREAVGRLSSRRWTRFFAGGVLLVAQLSDGAEPPFPRPS